MGDGDGNSSLHSAPGAYSLRHFRHLVYWYKLRELTTICLVWWNFHPLQPEGSKSQYLTLCQNATRNPLVLLDLTSCMYLGWVRISFQPLHLFLLPWEIWMCFYPFLLPLMVRSSVLPKPLLTCLIHYLGLIEPKQILYEHHWMQPCEFFFLGGQVYCSCAPIALHSDRLYSRFRYEPSTMDSIHFYPFGVFTSRSIDILGQMRYSLSRFFISIFCSDLPCF